MVHNYLVENFYENVFAIFYVLNLILLVIAYKLGFARKISLLKSIVVYILLAIGTFIVSIMSSVAKLPTVESLIIINIVLAIYRFRMYLERKSKAEH